MTQVTEAMIEAGVKAAEEAFWENVPDDDVRAIYLAMQAASLSPKNGSEGVDEGALTKRVTDILYARLDLNGHTYAGVHGVAAYIVAALKEGASR